MKKFLVTLIVIILAVSVGFGVFYLVRDTEVISLGTASLYKDVNDSFEVSLDMKDPNSYTTVEVSSSDSAVLEVVSEVEIDRTNGVATGTFKAIAGGNATITFKTNNAKFRNITCDVVVCDGSEEFPFRIDNAEELQEIGTENHPSDKSYTLNANIDLGALGHAFNPISSFSGVFDGAGYTISNLVVRDASASKLGLFQEITSTGVVKNVKFDGAVIEANGETTSAGVVAGDNYGTIKLIEVMSSSFKCVNSNAYVGGIAGRNISTNKTLERQVARIDRCSANVQLGSTEESIKGYVGGLTAQNNGGVIINSYAKGDAYAKDVNLFGGIVAHNKYLAITESGDIGYNGSMGAKVKDCYSIVKIHDIDSTKMGHIVAKNDDSDNLNKFAGNYYLVRENETKLCGIGESEVAYSSSQDGTKAEYESESGLKEVVSRVSYIYYNKKAEINGNKVEIVEDTASGSKIHFWNMNVWKIDSTKNDGYPILTYVDEYIDDNFDNSTSGDLITNRTELENIKNNMSGSYYIQSGVTIDLGDAEWSPIGYGDGTKSCIPFSGSLVMLDGSKITGLKITEKVYDYAGLFGILTSEAQMVSIVMENVNITSASKSAGAIAGQNSGTISLCTINNGVINGAEKVGAVTGENKGIIADTCVTSGENSTLIVKALNSTERTNAGGIAGLNSSSITRATVKSNVKVTSESLANIGCIAGKNTSTIDSCLVAITRNGYGAITSKSASVGGIAGTSTGVITSSRVKSATVSANTSNDNSNAGGIVGELTAEKAQAVYAVVVEDVYVSAYYAGGITARLNTSYKTTVEIAQDSKWDFDGSVKVTSEIKYETDVTISSVAIESSTTLAGNTTGGFVVSMSKGIIADSYVKATLSGSNNAGLVWTINYYSSSSEGGVIFDCYSTAKSSGGTSYAVSSSQIHNSWKVLGIGSSESDRTVGVIFDYSYVERDNMKNPEIPDPFSNKTSHCKSEADIKKAGTFGYLSATYWTVTEGSQPTLIYCEVVKELYN